MVVTFFREVTRQDCQQVPSERCEKVERQVARQECNPFLTPVARCQLIPKQQCQIVTKEVCDDRQCVILPKQVCTQKKPEPAAGAGPSGLPAYGGAACRTVDKEVCRDEVKPKCRQVSKYSGSMAAVYGILNL